ncbi:MAG: OadG family protein [Clostridia bacterium]|nr:OadG family protein [Clostridia bacterium]
MSISEALAQGAETAVVGLGTVFAVLIILMIVLHIMKAVFYKEPKPVETQVVEPEPVAEAKTDDIDEGELIAVLTAAIASSLNTSTYNLQIKSYRRVGKKRSAWNGAGIRETIDNRF